MMFYLSIGGLSLVLLFFFLLVFMKATDSAGNHNNALLIYYLGTGIWAVGCLGGTISEVAWTFNAVSVVEKRATVSKSKLNLPIKLPKKPGDHYSVIIWGMILHAIIYVVRRREWAQMIINAIRAWSSKRSNDRTKEILIQHALIEKDDREWVEKALKILDDHKEKDYNPQTLIPPKAKEVNSQEMKDH